MLTNLGSQAPEHGNQAHLKPVNKQLICQQKSLWNCCTLTKSQNDQCVFTSNYSLLSLLPDGVPPCWSDS